MALFDGARRLGGNRRDRRRRDALARPTLKRLEKERVWLEKKLELEVRAAMEEAERTRVAYLEGVTNLQAARAKQLLGRRPEINQSRAAMAPPRKPPPYRQS
jgi:hypothetical protein